MSRRPTTPPPEDADTGPAPRPPGKADPGDGPAPETELATRLAAVERRLTALEATTPEPQATGAAESSGGAGVDSGVGVVRYSGEVALHGEVQWQIDLEVGTALSLDDEPRLAVLAALGHPARAGIVRALLRSGPSGTTALQEAAGLASTGQLYHHLRALTHCGLVEQDARGSYRVAPRTVVPALVLLTAAADVAGQLRT